MGKGRKSKPKMNSGAKAQYGGTKHEKQTTTSTILNIMSMGPGCGLYNLGNTCYMNSILQCLARIPDFSSYLVSAEFRLAFNRTNDAGKTHKVDLVRELAKVISNIRTSSGQAFNCRHFKSVLGQACPLFGNFDQQDAHQFLVQLFGVMNDVLHQEVIPNNSSSDKDSTPSDKAWTDHKRKFNTIVTDLFGGQQSSSLKCKRCRFRSDVYSPFVTLSLPLPNEDCSLEDCFTKFCRGNTVSGWNCPRCQEPVVAESSYGITKLPEVLVIHLQRFEFTGNGWRKRQSSVDFPVSNADLHSIAGCDTTEEKSRVYDLYAVCNHWGTLQYGHYYAYGRGSVGHSWYEYNDSVVAKISEDYPGWNQQAAYLLFYVAREKSPSAETIEANNQRPEMPVSVSSEAPESDELEPTTPENAVTHSAEGEPMDLCNEEAPGSPASLSEDVVPDIHKPFNKDEEAPPLAETNDTSAPLGQSRNDFLLHETMQHNVGSQEEESQEKNSRFSTDGNQSEAVDINVLEPTDEAEHSNCSTDDGFKQNERLGSERTEVEPKIPRTSEVKDLETTPIVHNETEQFDKTYEESTEHSALSKQNLEAALDGGFKTTSRNDRLDFSRTERSRLNSVPADVNQGLKEPMQENAKHDDNLRHEPSSARDSDRIEQHENFTATSDVTPLPEVGRQPIDQSNVILSSVVQKSAVKCEVCKTEDSVVDEQAESSATTSGSTAPSGELKQSAERTRQPTLAAAWEAGLDQEAREIADSKSSKQVNRRQKTTTPASVAPSGTNKKPSEQTRRAAAKNFAGAHEAPEIRGPLTRVQAALVGTTVAAAPPGAVKQSTGDTVGGVSITWNSGVDHKKGVSCETGQAKRSIATSTTKSDVAPNGSDKNSRPNPKVSVTSEQNKMVQSSAQRLQHFATPNKGARSRTSTPQCSPYSQGQSGLSSNRVTDSEGNKRKHRNDSSGVQDALQQDQACTTSGQLGTTNSDYGSYPGKDEKTGDILVSSDKQVPKLEKLGRLPRLGETNCMNALITCFTCIEEIVQCTPFSNRPKGNDVASEFIAVMERVCNDKPAVETKLNFESLKKLSDIYTTSNELLTALFEKVITSQCGKTVEVSSLRAKLTAMEDERKSEKFYEHFRKEVNSRIAHSFGTQVTEAMSCAECSPSGATANHPSYSSVIAFTLPCVIAKGRFQLALDHASKGTCSSCKQEAQFIEKSIRKLPTIIAATCSGAREQQDTSMILDLSNIGRAGENLRKFQLVAVVNKCPREKTYFAQIMKNNEWYNIGDASWQAQSKPLLRGAEILFFTRMELGARAINQCFSSIQQTPGLVGRLFSKVGVWPLQVATRFSRAVAACLMFSFRIFVAVYRWISLLFR